MATTDGPMVQLRRSDDVVYRVLDDRVVVRRIGDHGERAAAELMGAAGVVWVASDPPATVEQVATMTGLTSAAVERAVEILTEDGWLATTT